MKVFQEALKNFGALTKYERQNAEKEAVARRGEVGAGSQSARSAATPSPASSTHSANVEKAKEVSLHLFSSYCELSVTAFSYGTSKSLCSSNLETQHIIIKCSHHRLVSANFSLHFERLPFEMLTGRTVAKRT